MNAIPTTRQAAGHCWKCGYRMQGWQTPTCPECGYGPKPAPAGYNWKAEVDAAARVIKFTLVAILVGWAAMVGLAIVYVIVG